MNAERDEKIKLRMSSGELRTLQEWSDEFAANPGTEKYKFNPTMHLYYEPDRKVTQWFAMQVLANWNGLSVPDKLDTEVEVELVLRAKVKVTAGFRLGVLEQYAWTTQDMFDDEKLAKAMVYASINPALPQHNKDGQDFWDGVGNMQGHITKIKLDTND